MSKRIIFWIFFGITILLCVGLSLKGQALPSHNYAVAPTFLLAQCPSGAVTGYTNFCSTGDGRMYACQTNCGASTVGWTCIAGCSGPVAGVTSINGKTGIVVLGATTTLQ